jgi:hypothetical protein
MDRPEQPEYLNPTYILCSRESTHCVESLKALKNVIDIYPQLQEVWVEDDDENSKKIMNLSMPSLNSIIQAKKSHKNTKRMVLPSIAHFNSDKKEYLHYDGTQYLMFIHNFIRDKRSIHMKTQANHVNSLFEPVQKSHSNLAKMVNYINEHNKSIPVGHTNQQIKDHLDNTQTFINNDFVTNMIHMSHLQTQKLYDRLNKK